MSTRSLHMLLESGIAFAGAFVFAAAYHLAITRVLSGAWVAHVKMTDIPDMLIFAVSVAFVYAALARRERGLPEWMLACGFSIMAFNMVIAIYANRALAIDPDSGAGALFIPVLMLSILMAVMCIHGYKLRISTKYV